MTDEEWNSDEVRAFGMRLAGDAMIEWSERGERVLDDSFLLLFNAAPAPVAFVLPRSAPDVRWELVLDSNAPELEEGERVTAGGEKMILEGRSLMVLRRLGGAGGDEAEGEGEA